MTNHCVFYVFLNFLHIALTARKPVNIEKSFQEPFAQNFSRKFCMNFVLGLAGLTFGGYWGPPGRHLGTSWALRGASWPLLGAPWALLGRFLGALGCLLAGLGRPLGASWLSGALQTWFLGVFWHVWGGFGTPSGAGLSTPVANNRCIYALH